MTVVISGDTGISPVTASGTSASVDGMTVGRGGGEVSTNTAVGASALTANTTQSNNTAVGYQAGYSNNNGGDQCFVGYKAGYATTGGGNSFVGSQAGQSNTTGSVNTGFGLQALYSNTTASNNTAVGYQALNSVQTAGPNTAIGGRALYYNTTSSNTAIGYYAGFNITTGDSNVLVGDSAGGNLTTGYHGIYVGYNAQPSSGGSANEIVIGYNTTGKGSGTGYINPYSGGNMYQGSNGATWSVTSDQRLKKNIVDNTEGLSIISQIRVRNFEYRTAEEVTELPAHSVIDKQGVQLGVIAQELQEVCGDCVKTESTGVMSVNQDNITWHMVNAIKDLKTIVDAQATEIAELKTKVA